MNIDKEMFIDALCGIGFYDMDFAIEMEKKGLAYYSGDQRNPNWYWSSDKLMDLSMDEIAALYEFVKVNRASLLSRLGAKWEP